MITNIGSLKVHFLGDPHLGKKFQNGVPLHRRGEREASQFRDLEASLRSAGDCDMHINVGDVFDKPYVSYDVLHQAADLYLKYAEEYHQSIFVILAGNHEVHRDFERKSCLDLFEMMTWSAPNIEVVRRPTSNWGVLFLPYNMVGSIAEIAEEMLVRPSIEIEAVVGHLDIDLRSNPDTLVPTKVFEKYGITTYYGGHDHLPRTEVRDGVTINVIGSMQPYSHAEDPNERIYVTRTLDQVRENPEIYRDKCLRVDQVPDFEIDCLQLTVQRKDRETDDISVDLGAGFDLDRLMDESLSEVNEEIRFVVKQKFMEMRGV